MNNNSEGKKKLCEAEGCGRKFWPKVPWQVYHSQACKNREAQRRLRERAKLGETMLRGMGR
jgi:hypothetical protein